MSPNFRATEFDCPCGQCTETQIDEDLVSKLQQLRDTAGSIKINSGYRCANYQEELRKRGYETAKGVSQHELGKAADICIAGLTGPQMEEKAKELFKAIGVGRYFVHVDLRDDKERRWTYARF